MKNSWLIKAASAVATITLALAGTAVAGGSASASNSFKNAPSALTSNQSPITSLPDFERLYGGLENLSFSSGASTLNYVAHATLPSECAPRVHSSRIAATGHR